MGFFPHRHCLPHCHNNNNRTAAQEDAAAAWQGTHTHTGREIDREGEREGETGTDNGRLKETLLLLGSCLFD